MYRNLLFCLAHEGEYTPTGTLIEIFEILEKEELVEIIDASYDMGNTYGITEKGLKFLGETKNVKNR